MTDVQLVALMCGVALIGFALGCGWGVRMERWSWLTRAMPPGQTAHHCNGKFYYVIEEGYFCREYRLARTIPPPRKGSGD